MLDYPHALPLAAPESEIEHKAEYDDVDSPDTPGDGQAVAKDDDSYICREDQDEGREDQDHEHDKAGIPSPFDGRCEDDVHGIKDRVDGHESQQDQGQVVDLSHSCGICLGREGGHKDIRDQDIGRSNSHHIKKGQMESGIGAPLCEISFVRAQILADEHGYGYPAADHRHEGEGVNIECDVCGRQAVGSEPSHQEDKDGKPHHLQKELHP